MKSKLYTLDNKLIKETESYPLNFTGIIEYDNGTKRWFTEGTMHRLDGPAYEGADGTKIWYVEGKVHRLDGPAYIDANGGKQWFAEGKRHRLDGPAYEHVGWGLEWHVDDKQITEEQCKLLHSIMKLKGLL